MKEQLIISVGREFGSGGLVIAKTLAERFELPLYDSNLLEHIAEERNMLHHEIKEYDEKPRRMLVTRRVRGYSNSLRENIAYMQFDYLKKKAAEGKSFVVVGRCSETILKGYPGLVSIFILGDRQEKIERVKNIYHVSEQDAIDMMGQNDRGRKMYHNYYCKGKWGDSRNYDLSINSSRLGVEGTADMLEIYIRKRLEE